MEFILYKTCSRVLISTFNKIVLVFRIQVTAQTLSHHLEGILQSLVSSLILIFKFHQNYLQLNKKAMYTIVFPSLWNKDISWFVITVNKGYFWVAFPAQPDIDPQLEPDHLRLEYLPDLQVATPPPLITIDHRVAHVTIMLLASSQHLKREWCSFFNILSSPRWCNSHLYLVTKLHSMWNIGKLFYALVVKCLSSINRIRVLLIHILFRYIYENY